MKLSTNFIAALAIATSTSSFMVAVSAEDACDSITDATRSFEEADEFLRFIPKVKFISDLVVGIFRVIENLNGCATDILTTEEVERIAECVDRENDVERQTNGVDSLASSIKANKLPTPYEFDNYATQAQALEADGASIGYQAALLNVDLATIKLAMFTGKYLSLKEEEEDMVNNAKGQAFAGIEKSLEYMNKLEEDLESILAEKRTQVEEIKSTDCKWVDKPICDESRPPPCGQELRCKYRLELDISYWCNSETYTYSSKSYGLKKDVPEEFSKNEKKMKVEDSEEKMRDKFFPAGYHNAKRSLCDSFKTVGCSISGGLSVLSDDEICNTMTKAGCPQHLSESTRNNCSCREIVECLDKQNDLNELTNAVDSLANSVSSNNLPNPSDLNRYADQAQALEANGASIGYQAALLNVELAVIKRNMLMDKYLSLEDRDEVNNAKNQTFLGIKKSLENMERLEEDLDDTLANKRELVTKRKCTKGRWDACTEWRLEIDISYGCESETYTYSTRVYDKKGDVPKTFPDEDDKIKETEREMRNNFFPTDVKTSLCDSLKEVGCSITDRSSFLPDDEICNTMSKAGCPQHSSESTRNNCSCREIVECLDKQNDLNELTNAVDSLANSVSSNNLPNPSDLNRYADQAQALEANGASIGYQAALLNVELAVIKRNMLMDKLEYFFLLADEELVNTAKNQTFLGIKKSLENMERLEEDLDGTLANKRELVTKRKCTKGRWDACTEWRLEMDISYGCESETYTYSTRVYDNKGDVPKTFPSEDDKIKETERKMRNNFFPTDVKTSLCDLLKEVGCSITDRNSFLPDYKICNTLSKVGCPKHDSISVRLSCSCREIRENNSAAAPSGFGPEL